MITCVACQCGSSDGLIRSRLSKYQYSGALTVDIVKGKEKSFSKLNTLPQFPDIEMLRNYIRNCTKYAVVIGYDDDMCRWVDLASGKAALNDVELKNILSHFA